MENTNYIDNPVVPDDAGEYAEALIEIMNRIPSGWGRWISCGKGWYPLIVETDKKMRFLYPEYEIHQIKEKFGELRFYWGIPAPETEISESQEQQNHLIQEIMHDVEANSENRSRYICELCGDRGSTRSKDYWYKTLCASCAMEHGYPLEDWEKQKNDGTK
jgi:hypothetical protein